MRSRRFLPSLSLLIAFEAVVRAGTTADAARSLNLTQSAISRLVKQLEGQLGIKLFERRRKRLVPTDAALSYSKSISRALDAVEKATLEMVSNPRGGNLSLAVLPAFGTRWLAPRLAGFQRTNPGVTLNLATRLKRFNLVAEGFDAAIHYGSGDWRSVKHMKLFDERVTACASPEFLRSNRITIPADLKHLPLFQIEGRPSAWMSWFEAHGVIPDRGHGMLFDQFAPMTQAAIVGLGVALLPDYLAEADIAEGRLVPLFDVAVPGNGAYWLVWPEERSDYPPLDAFRNWLGRELNSPAETSG